MRKICLYDMALSLCLFVSLFAMGGNTKEEIAIPPVFDRAHEVHYQLDGILGHYLSAVTDQWLLEAPKRNPGIFDQISTRNQKPYKRLLPWSGEFTGKYLTGAVQILRLSDNPPLLEQLRGFVEKLISLQSENGYLGVFPDEYELTGTYTFGEKQEPMGTWDAWNHYHVMIGLLLWDEYAKDPNALQAAQKIGDLLCATFLGNPKKMVSMGSSEMNLAPIHSLCILYRKTGIQKYLDLARQIVTTEFPEGGDYYRQTLEGKEYYQGPKPRWESLHPIMGLAELYWITGEESYRKAYEQIWWSIVKLDRHNTGGFSTGEQAIGSPYGEGAIETCCTIAWAAMTVEMLKLTGDSRIADELELTLMNGVLGYQSPDGKWSTYDTPMNGVRGPNTVQIAFQKLPGSEEFNCCSANAPRGIGLFSEWGLMQDQDVLVLNGFAPGSMKASLNDGWVTLKQETEYPRTGIVKITVNLEKDMEFGLKLRIPYWSAQNTVTVNDTPIHDVKPGQYLTIKRQWKNGDTLVLTLDFSLHFWAGEKEREGKASLYRGPILLACNVNSDLPNGPELDAKALNVSVVEEPNRILTLDVTDIHGKKCRLVDFASLGWHDDPYISWLNVKNAPHVSFSKDNPLRSGR